MSENSITLTRCALEQMDTKRLDILLNEELEKDCPSGETVRLILDVLWQREKNLPVQLSPKAERAWAKYQKNLAGTDAAEHRSLRLRRWSLRAAVVAAMLCLVVLAVPQKAEADSLFEKLARLTDSIVEFFAPGLANDNLTEYVFETDHPGLQQVYDTVAALGVSEPVVPTWLPEGYELVECKTDATLARTSIAAYFKNDTSDAVLKISLYDVDVSHEYHWDGEDVRLYEHHGNSYSIMRNYNNWVVIWFTEKVEVFLTLDCQEGTLYTILDSIYVTEDKTE